MCVTRCRFRWGLYNQPYGTTAWIMLLMPYCIHGYMKVDWQKQRRRWQVSGCLLFPEIFSLFKWLSSRIRELVKESEKDQSCSLKHCRKKILLRSISSHLNQTKLSELGSRLRPSLYFQCCIFCKWSECSGDCERGKTCLLWQKPPVCGTKEVSVCVCAYILLLVCLAVHHSVTLPSEHHVPRTNEYMNVTMLT